MCNVTHVGEVEEVLVIADLEIRSPLKMELEETRSLLDVPFAEDSRWTDDGRKQLRGFRSTVCRENIFFCFCLENFSMVRLISAVDRGCANLCVRIVVRLSFASYDWPPLVCIDQVS